MFYRTSISRIRNNFNLSALFPNLLVGPLFLLIFFLPIFCPLQATKPDSVTVRILQIIAHPALDKTQKGIIDGLKKTYPNLKITVKIAQGNILNATMIAQKFVSEQVDVIAVLGTSAAQVAAKAAYATKTPVVFASITDPLDAKLVKDLMQPGGHVTGVSNYTAQKPQLLYFKELLPKLEVIGIIMK